MTEPDRPPAVRLDRLTLRFGGKTILDRFSLDVAPGERVTLTGRSGSGKTSILRCILGFTIPDEGAVFVGGERLTCASVWPLRAKLAYVAQEPDLGPGTVTEILERPFLYRANRALRKNLDWTPELFDRFMLGRDLLNQPVTQLSGGEKQRVALISSILLDRRIFLLDEVSSALDSAAKSAVLEYFRPQDDLAVMSVSHDTQSFNDRIVDITAARESSNE
jgi:putative ABC transport system ATP-binding protein